MILWDRARRPRSDAETLTAHDVSQLAVLVRTASTAQCALMAWADRIEPVRAAAIRRVGRAVSLGAPPARAVGAFISGSDAKRVSTLLEMHARGGGDLSATLDALASWMRARDEMTREAQAATAAARLSGRVVSCLPVAAAPFVPLGDLVRGDRFSVVIVAVGLLLVLAGMRWMKRLLPAPEPDDDGIAVLCEMLAHLLRAGVDLHSALEELTRGDDNGLDGDLPLVKRRVSLGASWTQALSISDAPGLRELARVLENAFESGMGPHSALEEFAASRRRCRVVELEERSKKASVKMMIPLTLCVLPGFLLLGLSPFLHTVTGV